MNHPITCIALAALLTPLSSPAQDQKNDSAPTEIRLNFVVDGERFEACVSGDDIVISLNGKEMAEERYQRNGSTVTVCDAFGAAIALITLHPQGAGVRCFTQDRRPYVGVDLKPLGPALAGHLGIGSDAAAHLVGVTPGSPAQAAGLQVHDIITHFNGHDPVTPETFRKGLDECEPGEEVVLKILRRGEKSEVVVRLGRAPRQGAELYPSWAYLYSDLKPGAYTFQSEDPFTKGRYFVNDSITLQKGGVTYVVPEGGWLGAGNEAFRYWLNTETETAGAADQADAGEAAETQAEANDDGPGQLRDQIDRLEKRIGELEELIRSLRDKRDN